MSARRITVLISGRGSNLLALIEAVRQKRMPARIIHVISNKAGAPGLSHALRAGIPSSILEHDRFGKREEFDRSLALLMTAGQPDVVVLAGFMRILGPAVLTEFDGRMINLHPSLLPLYPGTATYQRAIDSGDREHGASIHFVTDELDGGPVISQVRIPIAAADDADSLAARLSPREHELLVATVELFSRNSVKCRSNAVWINGKRLDQPLELLEDNRFEA